MRAKDCCGSCKFCSETSIGVECDESHLDYDEISLDNFCKEYYEPREPVKSEHEKMWNELRSRISAIEPEDNYGAATISMLLDFMRSIEKEIKKEEAVMTKEQKFANLKKMFEKIEDIEQKKAVAIRLFCGTTGLLVSDIIKILIEFGITDESDIQKIILKCEEERNK